MDFLQNHIEAIVFCSKESVPLEEIHAVLQEMFEAEIPEADVQSALDQLLEKYSSDQYAFGVYFIGGGYQFLTKPSYQASISIHLKQKSKKRLTTSAMETLAIIAYKQPISKSQIELIRGVNCDYAIQKLLEKELVEMKGKAETLGRPVLYGTSPKFMDYFGLNQISDLPQPKDLSGEDNAIGLQSE